MITVTKIGTGTYCDYPENTVTHPSKYQDVRIGVHWLPIALCWREHACPVPGGLWQSCLPCYQQEGCIQISSILGAVCCGMQHFHEEGKYFSKLKARYGNSSPLCIPIRNAAFATGLTSDSFPISLFL